MYYNAPFKEGSDGDWKPQKVAPFETVEDFWCLYNNLLPPSRLAIGSNYHVFKEGILPEWEHKENIQGGKWVAGVTSKAKDSLDELWLWTLLALIGEHFEDSEEICGSVVSPRKGGHKLALWTRTAQKKDKQTRIGQAFKACLAFDDKISYQVHRDAMTSKSSFKNKMMLQV